MHATRSLRTAGRDPSPTLPPAAAARSPGGPPSRPPTIPADPARPPTPPTPPMAPPARSGPAPPRPPWHATTRPAKRTAMRVRPGRRRSRPHARRRPTKPDAHRTHRLPRPPPAASPRRIFPRRGPTSRSARETPVRTGSRMSPTAHSHRPRPPSRHLPVATPISPRLVQPTRAAGYPRHAKASPLARQLGKISTHHGNSNPGQRRLPPAPQRSRWRATAGVRPASARQAPSSRLRRRRGSPAPRIRCPGTAPRPKRRGRPTTAARWATTDPSTPPRRRRAGRPPRPATGVRSHPTPNRMRRHLSPRPRAKTGACQRHTSAARHDPLRPACPASSQPPPPQTRTPPRAGIGAAHHLHAPAWGRQWPRCHRRCTRRMFPRHR